MERRRLHEIVGAAAEPAVGEELAPEGVFSALNAGGRGQDLCAHAGRTGQNGLHQLRLPEGGLQRWILN
jgi:hypothetical protein